jgi:hypothetical protein
MRVKNKVFTDNEINQYCQGVEELLKAINERSDTKKPKKSVIVEEAVDDTVMSDEEYLVLS